MRAIVQRISSADVTVDGQVVGRIGRGLLIYVGVAADDGPEDVSYLANKIRYLRIFPDAAGKMNLDVAQADGAVMVVSNFTLYADTRQGRRPAFTQAADPSRAESSYNELCRQIREMGLVVETGRFREHMHIASVNDGPINIIIDSRLGS